MVGVCPLLYLYWKFVRIEVSRINCGKFAIPLPYPRFGWFTHMVKPHEADITSGVAEIETYTKFYQPRPPKNEIHRYGSLVAQKLHLW